MKSSKIFLAVFLITILAGCVDSETYETRINFKEADVPALVTMQFENISSTATDPAEVKKDFEQLIHDWKGDEYLTEQAKHGFDIKDRKVFIRGNKIMGQVTLTTKNLEEQFHFFVMNGERIMLLDGIGQPGYFETNGKVLKTGKNTLIIWPEGTKELYWRESAAQLSEAFHKNQSVMLQLLKSQIARQTTS